MRRQISRADNDVAVELLAISCDDAFVGDVGNGTVGEGAFRLRKRGRITWPRS